MIEETNTKLQNKTDINIIYILLNESNLTDIACCLSKVRSLSSSRTVASNDDDKMIELKL